jgi:hypothetical protein
MRALNEIERLLLDAIGAAVMRGDNDHAQALTVDLHEYRLHFKR